MMHRVSLSLLVAVQKYLRPSDLTPMRESRVLGPEVNVSLAAARLPSSFRQGIHEGLFLRFSQDLSREHGAEDHQRADTPARVTSP
jgi:hypothetical protein